MSNMKRAAKKTGKKQAAKKTATVAKTTSRRDDIPGITRAFRTSQIGGRLPESLRLGHFIRVRFPPIQLFEGNSDAYGSAQKTRWSELFIRQ
jgi:hypothetical protein